jgi:integrase/recombinase XerD
MNYGGNSQDEMEVTIRLDREERQAHICSSWAEWSRKLERLYGSPKKVTGRDGKVFSAFRTVPLTAIRVPGQCKAGRGQWRNDVRRQTASRKPVLPKYVQQTLWSNDQSPRGGYLGGVATPGVTGNDLRTGPPQWAAGLDAMQGDATMRTTQREIRYLTTEELLRLRRHAEAQAVRARERGTVGAVRAWALLHTLLSSGLRASEAADLRVGDCLLGYGQASLVVRQGKGGKQREVFISQELKTHLKAFLTWKRDRGEDVSEDAPVFLGQRGPITRNGVWRIVKGFMAAVGLDPRYATHSCCHSYATHLYRASGNDLEVVQEQLGHASIKTTTIYAKVTKEDKLRAADALTKAYQGLERKSLSGATWTKRRSVKREMPMGTGVRCS